MAVLTGVGWLPTGRKGVPEGVDGEGWGAVAAGVDAAGEGAGVPKAGSAANGDPNMPPEICKPTCIFVHVCLCKQCFSMSVYSTGNTPANNAGHIKHVLV